jgi:hypothetical protein
MKKILVLVFAAAILAAPRAQAQEDKMVFNHMALGVTMGVDGLGLDLAMPLGRNILLRGGYGIDAYGSLIPVDATLNLGTVDGRNLDNIPVSAKVWSSGTGHLLMDFFLSKKGGFHFSAGAFVNNGKLFSVAADLSKVLDPEDWGTVAVGGVSTDKNGIGYVDIKHWNVMPYVGLGFGRALNPEKTFNFVFDMGVMVWGRPEIQSRKYTVTSNYEQYETAVITAEKMGLKEGEPVAKLMNLVSQVPVCPYIRFGFYFKLF